MSDAAALIQPASIPAAATTENGSVQPSPAPPSPVVSLITPLIMAIDRQLHPDAGEFVGRQHLRDTINTFTESTNRMLVFTGSPGIGKTAFAAQLVRERLSEPHPFLAHFCSLPGGDNPIEFCRALAAQLKAYLGDEYQIGGLVGRQLVVNQQVNTGAATGTKIVAVEVKELKLGDIHPREAFRSLVREPLQTYHTKFGRAPSAQPLTIVIDGLDRVWQWDGGQSNNIISVLTDVQDLPQWVNFICTARPGPAVQALRAQAGVRVWDIGESHDTNNLDITAYLNQHFLAQLDQTAHATFDQALAASRFKDATPSPAEAFVASVVDASQETFGYVRRYVGAWRRALDPATGSTAAALEKLLTFDRESLDTALKASYEAIYEQIRPILEAEQGDADQEVVATLSLAFEPLPLKLLAHLAEWTGSKEELLASLGRLAPVLDVDSSTSETTYSFYHRGFTEYVRQLLDRRERDLQIARLLEQSSDDARLHSYATLYRWSHLLRGMNLALATRETQQASATPQGDQQPTLDWHKGTAQVAAIAPDAVSRAQLLRLLAARALDPSESDVEGSWAAAIAFLKEAVQVLQRSRAILRLEKRKWRTEGQPLPREATELEQSLIALGDAYRVIAQRMDIGGRQMDDWVAERRGLYLVWDSMVRLPLTLYLLLILLIQGVREIHIPGALENLGRSQDWTIARLYVLSVSAYRRARALARQRSAEELEDDIVERLARTYMMMGAYDAASSTYDGLLSRPAALNSQWRRALWQFALGEVLLARQRPDRAAEVLNEALQIFQSQQAPVLQARALMALASAMALQADLADTRGDGVRALDLDDKILAVCGEALTAWLDVTKLQGDESASVDRIIAMSRIGNLLWKLTRRERLSDEQIRSANRLRASIGTRVFPQRFEHPVLRLFRMLATVVLPATLLVLVTLLVQSPNSFSIPTRTEPALQAPLVNLSLFPNNLISGSAALPTNLTNSDVARLITGSGLRQFAPEPPRISSETFSLAILSRISLIGGVILVVYLLLYTLIGLLILLVASPAHHQLRRPGRLTLEPDALAWNGQIPLGIWRDILRWLHQELSLMARNTRQTIGTLFGMKDELQIRQKLDQMRIPLERINRSVILNRTERGRLLGDFSLVQVVIDQPPRAGKRKGSQQIVSILGSLVFYEELCDELEQRLEERSHLLKVEIIRSLSGAVFLSTLGYTIILALIASFVPDWLSISLPVLGYSLSDLYVLVAPGILLPLLWWFVSQPLAARAVRGRAEVALIATALIGGGLAIALLQAREEVNLLGLEPDFFTLTLAAGILAAVALNAARPLNQVLRSWQGILRIGMALLALVGTVLLIAQIGITFLWYDALVRGSLAVQTGINSKSCASGDPCPVFDDAVSYYTRMICLRPGASKGYAFRGLAKIAQEDYAAASTDFANAIRTADRNPPAPPEGCGIAVPEKLPTRQIAALHSNLGASIVLQVRDQVGLDDLESFYQDALAQFLQAISLTEIENGIPGPATQIASALPPPGPLRCAQIAQQLLGKPISLGNKIPYLLQLGDTCYNRGFNLARIDLHDLADQNISASLSTEKLKEIRRAAWDDLNAAVLFYSAIVDAPSTTDERIQADRGRAAAWFIMGQISDLPNEAPTSRSYLLRALSTYRALEQTDIPDESIYAGQAWSLILLDAWSDANAPLVQAVKINPDNPTYPALQGLTSWLDSTRFSAPRPSAPSVGYTSAISNALELYTRSILLSDPPRSEAYATRSVLFYSLRNSPRGTDYVDEDYGFWMKRALSDIQQAIVEADREQRPADDTLGYRYWRGRLSFTLALTWQRRLRGLHTWDELVPLYSQALDDFSTAATIDPQVSRRREYETLRVPWAGRMLNNAVHMQLAERAITAHDYDTARLELELVEPTLSTEEKRAWDPLGEPRPEYSLLHGLLALALDQPSDFFNAHTSQNSVDASFKQFITDAQRNELVDPQIRPAFLQNALDRLDALIKTGDIPPDMIPAANRAREQLIAAGAGS